MYLIKVNRKYFTLQMKHLHIHQTDRLMLWWCLKPLINMPCVYQYYQNVVTQSPFTDTFYVSVLWVGALAAIFSLSSKFNKNCVSKLYIILCQKLYQNCKQYCVSKLEIILWYCLHKTYEYLL